MTTVAVGRSAPQWDRERVLNWLQAYGVYAAIAVVIVANAIVTDHYLTKSNLNVQLFQVCPTILLSLGMALVIGTEGVDLSVGAVMALASAIIPILLTNGVWAAIAVALVAGAVSGVIGGSMIAFARVQPIVATLALMIGVRGVAVIFNGNQAKPVNDPTLGILGFNRWLGVPVQTFIALGFIAVVFFVVRRTTFGRQLVAVGDNRAASVLAGLPVRRVLMLVYVISGLFAALAGVIQVGHMAEADPSSLGLNTELDAITAVVVGGTPLSGGKVRVIGTAAGAVFMQLVRATLVQHNVPNSYAQIIEAAIICFAVYAARERRSR